MFGLAGTLSVFRLPMRRQLSGCRTGATDFGKELGQLGVTTRRTRP